MLAYLAEYESFFGPLRLFRYLTVRGAMAGFTAMLIGFIIAPLIIARLRELKLSQTLRNEAEVGKLASLHSGKKNTPTMGGLIVYFSIMISTVLWAEPNIYVFTTLVVFTGLTVIGFYDDYLKITKKNSKGLAGRLKLTGQVIICLVAMCMLLWDKAVRAEMLQLWVPFIKEPLMLSMPIPFVLVFFFLVVAGSSNAINLTDGVDGLAIGCTVTVALAYAIMAYAAGNVVISDYLFISHIPGSGELAIICTAMLGASLTFLWYNSHPAEVFMGDTGSLALGGLIGTIAFIIHQPLTLVIVGGIFVMEAGSVILQVISFKTTGKRIFRMSPIHHHFELKGWHESKVVIRFWILSLLFAIAGLVTLKLR
jgi:phospho-N-acetylmuramoyl-pentapeptide-transferase